MIEDAVLAILANADTRKEQKFRETLNRNLWTRAKVNCHYDGSTRQYRIQKDREYRIIDPNGNSSICIVVDELGHERRVNKTKLTIPYKGSRGNFVPTEAFKQAAISVPRREGKSTSEVFKQEAIQAAMQYADEKRQESPEEEHFRIYGNMSSFREKNVKSCEDGHHNVVMNLVKDFDYHPNLLGMRNY